MTKFNSSGALITAMGVIAFVALPINASAQLESIAGGAVVSQVISDLTNDINSIIDNVDYTVSSNSFQVRQHGQILIDQIGIVAEKASGKMFKDLRTSEQKAINDIRAQIDEIERAGKTTAADLRTLNNSFAQTLGSTVIGRKIPRVTYYTPEWIKTRSENADGSVQFDIEGFMLDAGEPTLMIGTSSCQRVIKIATKLSFSCPAALFNTEAEITSTPGQLKVYEKSGFFFRRTLRAYTYDIGSYVVPDVLGRYSVVYYVVGDEDVIEDRQQSFKTRNAHCKRSRTGLWNFSTSGAEWKIVPGSAKVSCSSSSKSSCQSVSNVTPNGFQFTCRIENNGDCIKTPFGTIKDGRGSCHGTASWKEKTLKSVKSVTAPETGEFRWGQDISLDMPDGTKSFKLTINQTLDPDRNEITIMTGTDNSNPWYELKSDLDNRSIVLSPRDIGDALSR